VDALDVLCAAMEAESLLLRHGWTEEAASLDEEIVAFAAAHVAELPRTADLRYGLASA
jgi:hypothetical protein